MSGALLRLLPATAILYLILLQPNHPAAMTWGALRVFPLELPVVVALLMLAGPGRLGQWVRLVLVALIATIALLKAADYGTFIAFNRGFNLLVDIHLLHAAWTLAVGSVGLPLAALIVAGGGIAVVAIVAALWWATGVWARVRFPGSKLGAAVLLVPALSLAIGQIGQARRVWTLPFPVPGAAFTARVGLERIQQWQDTRADLRAFEIAARNDPMLDLQPDFARLGERDAILIYVESYGRSSFDNPLYRPTHRATVTAIEETLRPLGLAIRSGWATAPMTGGQSWLAHGSVASGLWINGNGRYRAMLVSPRRTLYHFAQQAGRRTVAIMPAHVFPWPEGSFFGFDAIHNAEDLGYEGLPFNWVTMPDQFTLTALDRLERQGPDREPILAQVALVSSHAPWVPIPPLIDWDLISDGRVFNEYAVSGDPPDVVWRDRDRVRDQFRQAIDYSFQVLGSWAARQAEDPALLIILGDHQPARFVAGVDGFDVPVHVIGPPDLVERFAELGWTEGMEPAPDLAPIRMDGLRDTFLRALSSERE